MKPPKNSCIQEQRTGRCLASQMHFLTGQVTARLWRAKVSHYFKCKLHSPLVTWLLSWFSQLFLWLVSSRSASTPTHSTREHAPTKAFLLLLFTRIGRRRCAGGVARGRASSRDHYIPSLRATPQLFSCTVWAHTCCVSLLSPSSAVLRSAAQRRDKIINR